MNIRRVVLSTVCLAGLGTAAVPVGFSVAATGGPAWSQSGGDPAHTALISSPGGLGPATVGSLALAHSSALSDSPQTTPAVVGGRAYVATHEGRVIAVSAATGKQIWQQRRCSAGEPAENASEETTPAVGDGKVFVTESGGNVMTGVSLTAPHHRTCIALQPPSLPTGTPWSPTLVGHTVYEITASRVDAVSTDTGRIAWAFPLPSGSDPAADVVVWHGTVYAAFNVSRNGGVTGHVVALRPGDGHLVWAARRPAYISTMAASGGRLVAGGGLTSAWNAATGGTLWSSSCHGTDAVSLIGRAVVVTGGEAGTCQGAVQRLDAASGFVEWSTPIASELEAQASVGGGLVFVVNLDTSNVDILRLNNGLRIRSLHRASNPYDGISTPVVVGGTLWVTGTTPRLDAWALHQ